MTYPDRIAAWASIYAARRADGAPGWTTRDANALKWNRLAEALTRHGLAPPARILELGCGNGVIALQAAAGGYWVDGIDLVPEAIGWARDLARRRDLPASFHLGDLADMSCFADATFDVVLDGDCLHMVTGPERPRCLGEAARVLRPGGILLAGGNVRDVSVEEPVTFARGHGRYDPADRSITIDGERRYLLLSEEELCAELRAAGLRLLSVVRLPKRGGQAFVKETVAIDATR